MVQRVVLGALPGGGHGLRVSRPGYNVLDPGLLPSRLSFDSQWDRTLKVFMSDTVTVPVDNTGLGFTTVNFGRTFPAPPVCLVWMENPIGIWTIPGKVQFLVQGVLSGASYWFDNNNQPPVCRIFNNRLVFRRFVEGSQYGTYTARYIVLEGV